MHICRDLNSILWIVIAAHFWVELFSHNSPLQSSIDLFAYYTFLSNFESFLLLDDHLFHVVAMTFDYDVFFPSNFSYSPFKRWITTDRWIEIHAMGKYRKWQKTGERCLEEGNFHLESNRDPLITDPWVLLRRFCRLPSTKTKRFKNVQIINFAAISMKSLSEFNCFILFHCRSKKLPEEYTSLHLSKDAFHAWKSLHIQSCYIGKEAIMERKQVIQKTNSTTAGE